MQKAFHLPHQRPGTGRIRHPVVADLRLAASAFADPGFRQGLRRGPPSRRDVPRPRRRPVSPVSGLNGRHPPTRPQLLAAKLGSLGVGPDTQVVAYDDIGRHVCVPPVVAALRWLGHSQVAVLDGGLAWASGGKPVDTAPRAVAPATSRPGCSAT